MRNRITWGSIGSTSIGDYPEFAQFLVELGIDSMSLNPDSLLKTLLMVAQVEGNQR